MRCFIALAIDTDTTTQLLAKIQQLKRYAWSEEIRWFLPQNFHITLQFLGGHLENSKFQEIQTVMNNWIQSDLSAFKLQLDKLELFPSSDTAHTLIASVKNNSELQSLVDKLWIHTQKIGLMKSNQEFRPHISLGRICKQTDLSQIIIPKEVASCENIWLNITSFTLYQSELTAKAPIYTKIKSIKLP
ncbi:RNA 2',3'-cyclic phosphodiesterase [Thiomicrorhabdus hydrogeniphila]